MSQNKKSNVVLNVPENVGKCFAQGLSGLHPFKNQKYGHMLMAQRRRRTLLRHRWPGWKKVIVKAFRKAIQKNQTVESALTACTDPADIFAIFNDITAQVENWAKMNICHIKYGYLKSALMKPCEFNETYEFKTPNDFLFQMTLTGKFLLVRIVPIKISKSIFFSFFTGCYPTVHSHFAPHFSHRLFTESNSALIRVAFYINSYSIWPINEAKYISRIRNSPVCQISIKISVVITNWSRAFD
ncbi:hypothetical protein T12_7258 [Trichinella patagoniensis]|uniref:Uncharacterized protein n=1 Tax=Trichinella patagoniensis TaxID=990121 RepID=A0A0V0Z4A9_9BILA|nr:hypothetical protein T12_7258 [Trichinella patagoniensis]